MKSLIELPLMMKLLHKGKLHKIMLMMEEAFADRESAYDFVCEQLDAAQIGNNVAKEFVRNSGIPFRDYNGGMTTFDTHAGSIMLTNTNKIKFNSMAELTYANLYLVDLVMQKYCFGIYENKK